MRYAWVLNMPPAPPAPPVIEVDQVVAGAGQACSPQPAQYQVPHFVQSACAWIVVVPRTYVPPVGLIHGGVTVVAPVLGGESQRCSVTCGASQMRHAGHCHGFMQAAESARGRARR